MLRCGDGSLYTGIATDVQRRIRQHENGPGGAKYLRGRKPLELLTERPVGDRGLASKVEYRVKQLDRQQKFQLCKSTEQFDQFINDLKREVDAA